MAAITHAGSNWDTTGTGLTVTSTTVTGDLIVVVHGMSGYAGGDTSSISDNQGGSYVLWGNDTGGVVTPRSSGGGTSGALWFSVRTALVASGTSTVFTCTNVNHTGGGLTVLRISGMSRAGNASIRQWITNNTGTESPPDITFPANTLTGNPIILAILGEDNPIGITVPTDFVSAGAIGWASPTTGVQVCWVASGKTAATYSWTGGALTDHNEYGFEMDASALAIRDMIGAGTIPRLR